MPKIISHPDLDSWLAHSSELIGACIDESIMENGVCSLMLTGGHTAKKLYDYWAKISLLDCKKVNSETETEIPVEQIADPEEENTETPEPARRDPRFHGASLKVFRSIARRSVPVSMWECLETSHLVFKMELKEVPHPPNTRENGSGKLGNDDAYSRHNATTPGQEALA